MSDTAIRETGQLPRRKRIRLPSTIHGSPVGIRLGSTRTNRPQPRVNAVIERFGSVLLFCVSLDRPYRHRRQNLTSLTTADYLINTALTASQAVRDESC